MAPSTKDINWRARLYLEFVIVAGCYMLAVEMLRWTSAHPLRYFCYLALAIGASRIKIGLPGPAATIPLFIVFVFFGILEWSLPETVFLACTATLSQWFWHTSESRTVRQLLFNVSNMALAAATSYFSYHSEVLRRAQVDVPLLLASAAAVLFVMNTFPVAAVVALRDGRSLRLFWKDCYFWSLPQYLAYAAIAWVVSWVSRAIGWQEALLATPLLYLAHWSYSRHIYRALDEKKQAEEMAALHLRTIQALAAAIEAKDHTARGNPRRVHVFAIEIGKELGLSKPELDALSAAAVLHDIGKLAVPEHIVSKPGKLTREEFEKIKIHPVIGAEILEAVRFPYPVTPIVRSHHEKWNGSGYPDGLKGEEIPIGARILSAVDSLDARASDRQHRPAMPLETALRQVVAEAGTSFDPRVVKILERRFAEMEMLAGNQAPQTAQALINFGVDSGRQPKTNQKPLGSVADVTPADKTGDCLSHIAAARQEVQDVFELAQEIGSSLSLNETLSLLAIRLKRIIPYDSLAIYVLRNAVLKAEYVSGENLRLFSALEIPLGQGLSGWVAENRKPILNGNPAVEPGYLNDETKFTSMRSALSIPLTGLSGVVSVLTLYHSGREAFTRDHQRILMGIAPKVGHSIENALKFAQAESSASTDYMTGLPNARSLFLHLDGELARCRRTASPVVVLVCDLNGFKAVNDQFGHLEGNRLLKAVADKIKDCCREYDYVARMGGDEFVLVLPGLRLDQAKSTMQRLNHKTQEAGQEVCGVDTLSLSIGASMYPEDGTEAEQLLSDADRRMYQAKQKQKMRIVEPRGFDFDRQMAV
ncbi:MAG: diguanylate cyclase domain-containing protein [Bryobacteraceae bacterium]